MAVRKRCAMVEQLLEKELKKDRDYGEVPGVDRPFLFQPGAEKINLMFNGRPEYTTEPLVVTTEPFESVTVVVKCDIVNRNTDKVMGSGLGACSSRERKYRYRTVRSFNAKPGDRENMVPDSEVKKTKGRNTWTEWLVQIDPWEIIQTLFAMASKRAYVAATRGYSACSGLFTMDPDMVEAIRGTTAPKSRSSSAPSSAKAPAQGPRPMSEKQREFIKSVCERQGVDSSTLNQYCVSTFGVAYASSVESSGQTAESLSKKGYIVTPDGNWYLSLLSKDASKLIDHLKEGKVSVVEA